MWMFYLAHVDVLVVTCGYYYLHVVYRMSIDLNSLRKTAIAQPSYPAVNYVQQGLENKNNVIRMASQRNKLVHDALKKEYDRGINYAIVDPPPDPDLDVSEVSVKGNGKIQPNSLLKFLAHKNRIIGHKAIISEIAGAKGDAMYSNDSEGDFSVESVARMLAAKNRSSNRPHVEVPNAPRTPAGNRTARFTASETDIYDDDDIDMSDDEVSNYDDEDIEYHVEDPDKLESTPRKTKIKKGSPVDVDDITFEPQAVPQPPSASRTLSRFNPLQYLPKVPDLQAGVSAVKSGISSLMGRRMPSPSDVIQPESIDNALRYFTTTPERSVAVSPSKPLSTLTNSELPAGQMALMGLALSYNLPVDESMDVNQLKKVIKAARNTAREAPHSPSKGKQPAEPLAMTPAPAKGPSRASIPALRELNKIKNKTELANRLNHYLIPFDENDTPDEMIKKLDNARKEALKAPDKPVTPSRPMSFTAEDVAAAQDTATLRGYAAELGIQGKIKDGHKKKDMKKIINNELQERAGRPGAANAPVQQAAGFSYSEFGRAFVDDEKLHDNDLVLLNKSGKQIYHHKVSNDLKKWLQTYLKGKHSDIKLTDSEEKILDNAAEAAKAPNPITRNAERNKKKTAKLIDKNSHGDSKLLNDYEIYKGMIQAGNNNPNVSGRLVEIIRHMQLRGLISPEDAERDIKKYVSYYRII